jgi:hypothetical protein
MLRHVAPATDFAHTGPCLAAASGRDLNRRRVLEVKTAEGWAAVLPRKLEQIVAACFGSDSPPRIKIRPDRNGSR